MTGVLALVGLLCAQKVEPPLGTRVVAFKNVHVVPMDRERILFESTVIVKDGIVATVGPERTTPVPPEALVIDGKNEAYLMPGLADMHVHLYYPGDLLSNIANGVTLVRNMRGTPKHLAWRADVRSGKLIGPTVVTAGPILGGPTETNESFVRLTSPEQAEAAVAEQAAAGYDFIKVYDSITAPCLQAVIRSAHARGLKVAGHLSTGAGADGALRMGQDCVEHAEQFVYHRFDYSMDLGQLAGWARRVKASHAYVCPTLGIIDNYVAQVEDRESLFARQEVRFAHPAVIAWWRSQVKASSGDNRLISWFQNQLVAALSNAKVPLLSGTDVHAIGYVPGFALHRELARMHEAGLSNYAVLESTTANPGRYLSRPIGEVRAGFQADLLLVRSNPLESLTALGRRLGVMVRGKWIPQPELDAKMEGLAKEYAGARE